MSQQGIKLEKPKLIIGEGNEEVIVFEEIIINELKIDDIQILSYHGKDNLHKFLKTLPVIPGFSELRSLGITRDADQSFDAASNSINSGIFNNKLNEESNLKIETFILPDNCSSGMLEDLFIQSIPPNEISCIDDFFYCINNQVQRFPNNYSKAKIHAWLSTYTKPDKRLGEAAKAGYFNWKHEVFSKLISFIKSL
jgi:hypothetical protein